uniref:50S ribosomal protein L35 n=1 Tax=Nelumbo nucifera TaxID=4432 RepID=A0A822XGB4_NELNU|nr:TPA_asm: hypothetical protein HUJ06_020730 [Nelumbo nucifera]
MQRLCSKFRYLSVFSTGNLSLRPASHRLLHSLPLLHDPVSLPANRTIFNPLFHNVPPRTLPRMVDLGFRPSSVAVVLNQRRHFSSKERKRKPVTPATSKLKKIKMKSYSSFKYRFKTLNNGQIRRWRAGKRHNAHLKVCTFALQPLELLLYVYEGAKFIIG